ncbi:MAG: hypothetical protein MI923_25935 [Phycisphaerales bacterium]|nr:hypothetical protein [Phycisphaerales bacterium]
MGWTIRESHGRWTLKHTAPPEYEVELVAGPPDQNGCRRLRRTKDRWAEELGLEFDTTKLYHEAVVALIEHVRQTDPSNGLIPPRDAVESRDVVH